MYPPSPLQRTIDQTPIVEEPPFQGTEITHIFKIIPQNKAPGYDGIDNVVLKIIYNSFPNLLTAYWNKCPALQHFPKALKIEIVALFHKKDRNKSLLNSCRPITLPLSFQH
ncbi:hypothetical protein AVEN_220433-1 [Araneus ventricosus]|uniref:Reverse transcriptase domain-containing protein n=1 Tax=Araneus ventricosus TaxID=182803 RepID=A0A4Y2IPW4_ARAVE|nr:hypothetical protein AVEN_220433-1 [Araneus ventricosus]